MEIFIFFGLLVAAAIVMLYRSRRSTTDWRESPTAGLPDDQRDKFAYPLEQDADPMWTGVHRQQPVSRESGHGKDGS